MKIQMTSVVSGIQKNCFSVESHFLMVLQKLGGPEPYGSMVPRDSCQIMDVRRYASKNTKEDDKYARRYAR